MSEETGDSIRAAARVLKSEKFRFLVKLLAPFVYVAVGWLISQLQLGARVAAVEATQKATAADLAKLEKDVGVNRVAAQQAIRATGRYTAFAVASSQAYESTKMKQQKKSYAEDYAKSFERMVDDGTPADVALMKLFKDVAMP